MLAAGIIFFQDRASLKRTLDTLCDFDLVIAIDGAFGAYNSVARLSIDGSRELCKEYANVCLFDLPDVSQPEKRDAYLRAAEHLDADHLLIIDSDEWLEGDMQDNLPQGPGIFSVDYCNFEGQHYPAPRLVSRPELFSYYMAHNVMRRADTGKTFKLRGTHELLNGITMHSDTKLRVPDRLRDGLAAKEKMLAMEAPIKQELKV